MIIRSMHLVAYLGHHAIYTSALFVLEDDVGVKVLRQGPELLSVPLYPPLRRPAGAKRVLGDIGNVLLVLQWGGVTESMGCLARPSRVARLSNRHETQRCCNLEDKVPSLQPPHLFIRYTT